MDKGQFSQVNTSISIKEKDMISAEQFQKILINPSKEALANLLQEKGYDLKAADLDDLNKVEEELMSKLVKCYQWAYQDSPSCDVVDFVSLPYLYHNVKVLLKAKASHKELSHLLIPIGKYPLSYLEHLVRSLSSDYFLPDFVDEVVSIWQDYLNYQDYRVLEVGCDLAYFKHLVKLAEQLNDDKIRQAVDLIIEFYNFISVKRAKLLQKNQGFIKQILFDQGRLTLGDYERLADGIAIDSWFNQLNPDAFSLSIRESQDKLASGKMSLVDTEKFLDQLLFQLVASGQFETSGPYPLLGFLLGKEFEIKNLRLLISAIANDLPMDLVKERMRPIYGQ
ncbi:V-type ATPase subunit [Streptococcus hongkongensis]|nr:ATP synthase subunit C [Streptococcus uberis]